LPVARQAERQQIETVRALQATVNELGGKLMRNPDDEALTWLFQTTTQRHSCLRKSSRPSALPNQQLGARKATVAEELFGPAGKVRPFRALGWRGVGNN
jgi:hypothetical protein